MADIMDFLLARFRRNHIDHGGQIVHADFMVREIPKRRTLGAQRDVRRGIYIAAEVPEPNVVAGLAGHQAERPAGGDICEGGVLIAGHHESGRPAVERRRLRTVGDVMHSKNVAVGGCDNDRFGGVTVFRDQFGLSNLQQ